jgi:uncharacterized protein
MPELIHETVVTTCSADGRVHVAPMGVRYPDEHTVVLMPFKPSTTLDNVLATRSAVLNWLTDVRVFAGCVTGRRDWPTVAVEPAQADAPAVRLANALGHVPLALADLHDDAQRPVLRMARGAAVVHAPFTGFVRAQAAVLEGAVLVSRLHMLDDDKIDREFAYLQIAIDKTAGPVELEAWQWLRDAVAKHRSALRKKTAS